MKKTPKKHVDYTGWTQEQHAEYLRTHERYQAYYANYDPTSVEEFIDEYAKKKCALFKDEDGRKSSYDNHQTQFLSAADDYIDMILQKKLFNLQCQWRAGMIELPLIDVCQDFSHWENHIRECPFIPPVTQDEIDLCIRFLKEQLDFSDLIDPYDFDWQGYEKFKNQMLIDDEEDDDDDYVDDDDDTPTAYIKVQELPSLYDFFDTFQNTAGLLRLPNVRGEKEEMYFQEGIRLKRKADEEKSKADGTWVEPKPYVRELYMPKLHAYDSNFETFIEETEDNDTKEALKYYQFYKKQSRYSRKEDEIQEYINFLTSWDEPIAMKADENWRTAIILTVRWFKQSKIADMLPYVYETYLLEFDEDQPLEEMIAEKAARYHYEPDPNRDYLHTYHLEYKERVLDGRQSLDGVRDFNY